MQLGDLEFSRTEPPVIRRQGKTQAILEEKRIEPHPEEWLNLPRIWKAGVRRQSENLQNNFYSTVKSYQVLAAWIISLSAPSLRKMTFSL